MVASAVAGEVVDRGKGPFNLASGDGQHHGGGLVEADKLGIEEATLQVQRAAQGRFEVQVPADPNPAQADPSCIRRPFFADQHMPEHRRAHRPLFAPWLHLDRHAAEPRHMTGSRNVMQQAEDPGRTEPMQRLDRPLPAHVADQVGGAGPVGGGAGHAESGHRRDRVAVQVTDVPFDEQDLADVRERQIL